MTGRNGETRDPEIVSLERACLRSGFINLVFGMVLLFFMFSNCSFTWWPLDLNFSIVIFFMTMRSLLRYRRTLVSDSILRFHKLASAPAIFGGAIQTSLAIISMPFLILGMALGADENSRVEFEVTSPSGDERAWVEVYEPMLAWRRDRKTIYSCSTDFPLVEFHLFSDNRDIAIHDSESLRWNDDGEVVIDTWNRRRFSASKKKIPTGLQIRAPRFVQLIKALWET